MARSNGKGNGKPAKGNGKSTVTSTVVVPLIPQPHGGALKAGGTPGNKGGTGRPPDVFRRKLQVLADDFVNDRRNGLPALLKSEDERLQLAAFESAADRGFGKPVQPVAVEAEVRYIVEVPMPSNDGPWTRTDQ